MPATKEKKKLTKDLGLQTIPLEFDVKDNALALRQGVVDGKLKRNGREFEIELSVSLGGGAALIELKEVGKKGWRVYALTPENAFRGILDHYFSTEAAAPITDYSK